MNYFLVLTIAAFTAPSGQIAFLAATEQEDQRVCVLDLATDTVRPVGAGNRDGAPQWSPDGQWLAYVTGAPTEGTGVRIVRPDGSDERLLPHAETWVYGPPAWSPDGLKLAYTSGSGLDQRVMVYDLEAGTEEPWGSETQSILQPLWTGDSQLIAVGTTGVAGALGTDLFWVAKTSSTPARETLASTGDYVEWLPRPNMNGDAIAYESNDGGDREIFVFEKKRGALDVSNHRAADWNPVWSPDGEWVAFESFRDGRRGIYRVNPVQVRVSNVAADPGFDAWAPAWSPDSRWIAFVSNRDGAPRLYATDIEGDEVIPLTKHTLHDFAPAWRPETK
jgi:Tol biopolymer transport system component